MSKPPRCCKTYRLCIGRLADGREAFARAGYCISALGDYRFVDVWVRTAKPTAGRACTWSGTMPRPAPGPTGKRLRSLSKELTVACRARCRFAFANSLAGLTRQPEQHR